MKQHANTENKDIEAVRAPTKRRVAKLQSSAKPAAGPTIHAASIGKPGGSVSSTAESHGSSTHKVRIPNLRLSPGVVRDIKSSQPQARGVDPAEGQNTGFATPTEIAAAKPPFTSYRGVQHGSASTFLKRQSD